MQVLLAKQAQQGRSMQLLASRPKRTKQKEAFKTEIGDAIDAQEWCGHGGNIARVEAGKARQ